jgi:hypothetical protein
MCFTGCLNELVLLEFDAALAPLARGLGNAFEFAYHDINTQLAA